MMYDVLRMSFGILPPPNTAVTPSRLLGWGGVPLAILQFSTLGRRLGRLILGA